MSAPALVAATAVAGERTRPSPAPRDSAAPVRTPRRSRSERLAPLLLGAAALALLPAAAQLTDRDALGGAGLAGVLPVWAWVAVAAAVGACLLELLAPDPRVRVLTPLTGVLALCTTGLASVVEPGARIASSWWHLGFVGAIAAQGRVPAGVDARFSWAGFFSQWAWISDAAGGIDLDPVLRWTPPVVAVLWTVAVYALALRLLGGRRGPWVAAWLFLGLNWIEQDYFSPQATAMVLALAVLVVALGPLGTWRAPLTDAGRPRWRRVVDLLRPAVWASPRRWRSPHPAPGGTTVLVLWAVVTLCSAAMAVAHQLTPFALLVQLVLLTLAGRIWGGRGMVLVLVLAVATWVVLGGREFWLSQLSLATGDVGDASGSVASALGDRLVGDPGQLVVKLVRVVLALATVGLAAAGAWLRWRRTGEVVWIVAALAPAGLVLVQSYGGEVGLRVLLYALPLCALLGVEVLRSVVRRWPRAGRVVLALGMLALFVTLVVVRGGNDAYVALRPQEVGLVRTLLARAPAGTSVFPLADQAPNNVARVGQVNQVPSTCEMLAEDPVRCTLTELPDVVYSLPTMDAQGVVLGGLAPGWTRAEMAAIVATGRYRLVWSDGLYAVVARVGGTGDSSADRSISASSAGTYDEPAGPFVVTGWVVAAATLLVLGARAVRVERRALTTVPLRRRVRVADHALDALAVAAVVALLVVLALVVVSGLAAP